VNLDGSTSSMPGTNPFGGVIAAYNWNFGDGTGGFGPVVSHTYLAPGPKTVGLIVSTNQGCSNTATFNITVGPVPVVDFSWAAICTNDQTSYLDATALGSGTITTYTWDFGDGFTLTGPAGGMVPGGTHGGATTGTYKDPLHNFAVTSTYNTKLTVLTSDNCTNSLTQSVIILPAGVTETPNALTPYIKDFETNSTGWIPEGLRISSAPIVISPISWDYGTPAGLTINSAASGTKAWWTKQNIMSAGNPTYYNKESSVVNGPCFNLNQLKRPMISLDYWSDAETNLDGVVLQYSTNGGLNWNIIGPLAGLTGNQRDQGINWYEKNATIVSNPGNQIIGPYGWTDKSGGWKNGRFNLDMVNPLARAQVRVRLAFSSNDQNAAGKTYDGFAFDNVYVGEKQRNVLVEHFTNLPSGAAADNWINARYQDQLTNRAGNSDFYSVQYHMSFPNPDPFNLDNPSDPGARSLFYGVSQPPTTIIDGIRDGVKFTGLFTDLDANAVEVDRRALVDPLFTLQLDTIPAAGNATTITVRLSMTARKAVNTPLIAQVVLVENQSGLSKFIMRKQLFGPDGKTVTQNFLANDNRTETNTNVDINVPITNPAQLTLVGYVQNKNTKEILQSITMPILPKRGSVIVGLEDEAAPSTLNGISMYPNPANGEFYFRIPDGQPTAGFTWKVLDQRGITVRKGEFDDLINNTRQVDVRDLANGMYFVVLTGPGQSVVHRKLVVLNRN